MKISLSLSGEVHLKLHQHLFPGDGLEAVAVAICGRSQYLNDHKLLVHDVICIPHQECERSEGLLNWPTNRVSPYFELVLRRNMAILKIHSHPGGYDKFSETDDYSDKEFFESVYGWSDTDDPHGSAIMLPSGEIFGRAILKSGEFYPFEKVGVTGDDMQFWWHHPHDFQRESFSLRTEQAFGPGTIRILRKLRIGVIGCSGTGSPVVEQLARLGVGQLVLVDPDVVEETNLNRIVNSNRDDAQQGRLKVEVLKNAIDRMGLGTKVEIHPNNLFDNIKVLKAISNCDVIFGCVDTIDGRHLLNQLSSFYLIPYFDIGIKLNADGKGGIDQIHGTVHYLVPGKGSLLTRQVYTSEGLRASGMLRRNPSEYDSLRKSGYITNVIIESPAVISVNMLAASLAVNEFLARMHNFRNEDNVDFEITRFSLTDGYFFHEKDTTVDAYLKKFSGRGDVMPFLNTPELS